MNTLINAILISILATAFMLWATTPYDSTDDKAKQKRSGAMLYVDHGTGCHYLSGWSGVLTPRLDFNGQHICVEGLIETVDGTQ